ncbi:hypothetical protein GJ496_004432 [Pomphorhynchus laevis]|nr:hypothetical protein GJ496_004432 [Pomphorhynchus laevis]
MKAVRDLLNDYLFFAEDQRCIAAVRVTDLSKKKRDDRIVYLAIAVESDGIPFYCIVRKSEKSGIFKIKQMEFIKDINYIDARQDEPIQFDICLRSNRKLSLACDDPSEKQAFIVSFYKVIYHHYKSLKDAPKIINFDVPEELSVLKDAQYTQQLFPDNTNNEKFQVISLKEEEQLYKLLGEWGLDITEAEHFLEMSTKELSEIDHANVSAIVNAEKESLQLMGKLDSVIDNISQLEENILSFVERLDTISNAVKMMSEKDLLFQIENSNRKKLERFMEVIVSNLSVSEEDVELLRSSELTLPSNDNLMSIANSLLTASQFQLPVRLMLAIGSLHKEKEDITILCEDFCNRCFLFAKDEIVRLVNIESTGNHSDCFSLPDHSQLSAQLLLLAPIVKYIQRCNSAKFSQMTKVLKVSLAPVYNQEICDFVESARTAVIQKVLNNPVKLSSVISIDSLFNKSDKGLSRLSHGDLFEINSAAKMTRTRSSKIVGRVLVQLKELLTSQQNFFIQYYGISESEKQKLMTDKKLSMQLEEVDPHVFDSVKEDDETIKGETIRRLSANALVGSDNISLSVLMSEMFDGIENEIHGFLSYVIKHDQLNCMYIFVKLSELINQAEMKNSFVQKFFAALLITVKRAIDSFAKHFCDSILAYRIPKSKRNGLLPYVEYFQELTAECEEIFENSSRRVDLDKIYKSILAAIFKNLSIIAKESTKMSLDLILMENYHKIQHILRSLKISSLDSERKKIEEMYHACKLTCAEFLVAQAFDDINKFFTEIDQNLANSVKPEDIQYRSHLSAAEIKEIIRKNHWAEISKRLDNIYAKLQRTMPSDSSLYQVIWHDTQMLFISKFKHFNDLIGLCFPSSNINMEFDEVDILGYFGNLNVEEHSL